MPRIRKKTSKRGTTNQRQKIKHKVAESRKKAKKEAKKNTQWKSKHKKDPGIPNNFPYKDQILAEVQEQRRKVEEAKQRRKDEKKAAKAAAASGEDVEDDENALEVDEQEQQKSTAAAFDGVNTLSSGVSRPSKGKAPAAAMDVDEEDEEAPTLVDPSLPTLRAVLDKADAALYVLDARDPEAFRSSHLEELAQESGKKIVYIVNKIDACPRESLLAWTNHLRTSTSAPVFLFRSASSFLPSPLPTSPTPYQSSSKGKSKEPVDDAVGTEAILSQLRSWAAEKTGDESYTVAVVGLTNSGKSSLVNSLLQRPALPTYRIPSLSAPPSGPTTTERAQQVILSIPSSSGTSEDSTPVTLIDTPGIAWEPFAPGEISAEDKEAARIKDVLLRNKGRVDRLKDPLPAVANIVSRAETQDLMLHYNLPAFPKGDASAFLSGLARANGLVRKGGVLDLAGAARIFLRDWGTGKLPWYTVPTLAASSAAAAFTPDDEKVLEKAGVHSRKERRKTGGPGVVKMTPGTVDGRKVAVDLEWDEKEQETLSDDEEEQADGLDAEEDDDVEMDDEDDDEEDDEEEEGDDDDEDVEDDDEDEAAPPPPSGKRKRVAASKAASPPPPSKKVAFASLASVRVSGKLSKSSKPKVDAEPTPTPLPPKSALKLTKTSKSPSKSGKADAPTKAPKATKKGTPTAGSVAKGKSKTANAPKPGSGVKRVKDGEEAYDFGKFFR